MKEGKSACLGRAIGSEHALWKKIYQNGCGDPFWPDGTNLNLTRNHIIWYRRQCEEELNADDFPEQYYIPVPEEVDSKYMARADEIREHAQRTLNVYLGDENYQYLLSNGDRIDEKLAYSIGVRPVLGYVDGLRSSINNDQLVYMRRHEHPDMYLDSFRECRKRLEAVLGREKILPPGQLSIFDVFEL